MIIRTLLLALLVVMLPARGVMAAVMTCHPATAPAAAASAAAANITHGSHSSSGEEHARADHGAHHSVDAVPGAAGHHHDGIAGADTCNQCASCCSAPLLPSMAPAVPLPHDVASVGFPAFTPPAPNFLSDSLERPPRSI